MKPRKNLLTVLSATYIWLNLLVVGGASAVFLKSPSIISGIGVIAALGISLPSRKILLNLNDLEEILLRFLEQKRLRLGAGSLLFLLTSAAFIQGISFHASGVLNFSFTASAQIFLPVEILYSSFSETLASITFNYSRFYIHFLWTYLIAGLTIDTARKAGKILEREGNSSLEADILPFRGGKEAEIKAEIYIVTGMHGLLRIPESFCKECHLFVQAVQQAARETDKDVDIQVKSYWTRFLRPLLRGGIHPPVLLINGELFSQGYNVPDKDELVEEMGDK